MQFYDLNAINCTNSYLFIKLNKLLFYGDEDKLTLAIFIGRVREQTDVANDSCCSCWCRARDLCNCNEILLLVEIGRAADACELGLLVPGSFVFDVAGFDGNGAKF